MSKLFFTLKSVSCSELSTGSTKKYVLSQFPDCTKMVKNYVNSSKIVKNWRFCQKNDSCRFDNHVSRNAWVKIDDFDSKGSLYTVGPSVDRTKIMKVTSQRLPPKTGKTWLFHEGIEDCKAPFSRLQTTFQRKC